VTFFYFIDRYKVPGIGPENDIFISKTSFILYSNFKDCGHSRVKSIWKIALTNYKGFSVESKFTSICSLNIVLSGWITKLFIFLQSIAKEYYFLTLIRVSLFTEVDKEITSFLISWTSLLFHKVCQFFCWGINWRLGSCKQLQRPYNVHRKKEHSRNFLYLASPV
jgi:hypothetical protein